MKNINILVDYKNNFESKYDSSKYRGGMDKKLLIKHFKTHNIEVNYLSFSKLDFRENHKNKIYLYTSAEDPGYLYKSYIEDMVLGLTISGAIVLPEYKYLRANNNKVFMEILRDTTNNDLIKNIKSNHFGTHEELKKNISKTPKKAVLKLAKGASSTGVFKAESHGDLEILSKKVTKTRYITDDIRDVARNIKHKGYKKESIRRKKFIVQNVISGLKNDWKVLIYDKKYYVLYRPVRKNDFRASGSGQSNYLYGDRAPIPKGLLDFAQSIYNSMDTPNISIDIAFNGEEFYLIEFQALYFGTSTQRGSNCYYLHVDNEWKMIKEKIDLEKVYADSVAEYLKKRRM